MFYSDARVFLLKTVKDLQLQLKILRREREVWWFPPYASSRILIRYQRIKLKHPGLYFATFSAEKQIIPLRPPRYHTATAESSHHAECVLPARLVPIKVDGSSQMQRKVKLDCCSSRWSFCLQRGVCSVRLAASDPSCRRTEPTPSIFHALVVKYYCCTKLQKTIPHSDQAIII